MAAVGITYLEGTLTGPTGKQATINFLVDGGATYTVVPAQESRELELQPKRSVELTLADGTRIERGVSECHRDEPILGVVTLEILGLVLNPLTRTLQPMRMLLA